MSEERTIDILKTIDYGKVPTDKQVNAIIDATQILVLVERINKHSEPYLRGNEEEV